MDFVAVYVDSSGSTYNKRPERAATIETLLLRGYPLARMFSFGCEVHDDVYHLDNGGTFLGTVQAHASNRFGSNAPVLVITDTEDVGWGIPSHIIHTTFDKMLGVRR